MREKMLISFSGGRTSARMLYFLLFEWEEKDSWEFLVVFANTGKERPETLRFVHEVHWRWGVPINWIEYTPGSEKGWKVAVKEVDYFTASRKGEPFEAMIQKIGIPSTNAPFCSQVLKRKTIRAYARVKGWRKYYTAIGIRDDEIDRISVSYKKDRIVYPLISSKRNNFPGMTKPEILYWWSKQDFDLKVDPDLGNCDACWKKDLKLLVRIADKNPATFDWWQEMTDKYGHMNPRNAALLPPFNFYRGNMSPVDIFKLIEKPKEYIEEISINERLDGCSQSCEPF